MNNDDRISAQLTDIARVLGRVEGKLDATASTLSQHVEEDKALTQDVRVLQLARARQAGFLTAVGSISAIVGSAIVWCIERMIGSGHP